MDKIETRSIQFYDVLLQAIPNLKNCKNRCGGEGVAYFLDDNFVIKEYCCISNGDKFDAVFESYCNEIQECGNMGYAVPKIYAWVKIPNSEFGKNKMTGKYKYYILEERIKGRDLYYGFLEDFYPICQDLFLEGDYYDIIHSPDLNKSEFNEIIVRLVKDYIAMNEWLESIPENVLAKFIEDSYAMHHSLKYSEIDLFPSNIIIDENKMTLIDNHMAVSGRCENTKERLDDEFVARVACLFNYNDVVTDLNNSVLFKLKGAEFNYDYSEYQKKNTKVCKSAATRLINIMNKYCDNPKAINKDYFMFVYGAMSKIMGRENAVEVMKNIKTFGFQPEF